MENLMMRLKKLLLCGFLCVLVVMAPFSLHAEDEAISVEPDNVADSTISINSDVSGFSGSVSASIIIKVPPGRNEMAPKIILSYDSSAGNDKIGLGWVLEMGAIQRNTKYGINYSKNDFVFKDNGATTELVSLGSNSYALKIEESFSKYYWSGSGGWVVKHKDGTEYYYGSTPNSQQTNSSGKVFKWCLDKIQDSNGNYILFTYTTDQKEIYIQTIQYAGNVNGQSPSNLIQFYYESRPDTVTYAISPDVVSMRARLKTIAISTINGQRVRAYKFDYVLANTISTSMLEKVQEYGSDAIVYPSGEISNAATASTFPPITFTMSNEPINISDFQAARKEGDTGGFAPGVYSMIHDDINGDLKPDLVFIPYGGNPRRIPEGIYQYSYLTQGDGSVLRLKNMGVDPWLVDFYQHNSFDWPILKGDFNGDANMDFIHFYIKSNTRYVFFAKGDGSFENAPQSGTSDGFNYTPPSGLFDTKEDTYLFVPGDFNGDGKDDYAVMRNATGETFVYLSNGDGSFAPRVATVDYQDYRYKKQVIGDFNGDGKADYMWINREMRSNATDVFLSNGNGTFRSVHNLGDGVSYKDSSFNTGDFNGDGKTDYVLADGTGPKTFLSNGDGTFTSAIASSFAMPSIRDYEYDCLVMGAYGLPDGVIPKGDFNGDGKMDLAIAFQGGDGNFGFCPAAFFIFLSKGDGTFASPIVKIDEQSYLPAKRVNILNVNDYNADGKADFMWYYSNFCMAEGIMYNFTSPTGPLYKLTRISNGRGGTIDFTYVPSSSFTNTFMPFMVYVVSSVTKNDGLGNQAKTTYYYAHGLYDYPTREFRGFGYVLAQRPDNSLVHTFYHQDEYLKGRDYQTILTDPNWAALQKTEKVWETALIYDSGTAKSQFVKLSQTRTESYDDITVYAQQNDTYDDKTGNLLSSVTSGTYGENITTANAYANYGSWLWKKTKSTITGSTSGKVRETTYGYENSTGNMLWKTSWNNNGESPTVAMAYYSNGNLWTTTDARGNTTTIEYETATNTYPSKIMKPSTNGVAHVTNYLSYDYRVGKPQRVVDENGQSTNYFYDRRCLLATIGYPDGGVVTKEYYDFTFPQFTISKTKEDSSGNMITEYNFADGLGRHIEKLRFGESGKTIVNKTEYDGMDRITVTRGPFFSTGVGYNLQAASEAYPWTQTTYDYRGRVLTVTSPHKQYGTVTWSYDYSGLDTITTDPEGNRKKQSKDYLDRITIVTEYLAEAEIKTRFAYNAADDMLTITDHNGNVTSINYDTLGRKLNMTDTDRGTWYYTYDPNNNRLTQKDAKGQTITFTYDALNRVQTKIYPDGTINTYTYDNLSISNGSGRLYSVLSKNNETLKIITGYDALGRIKSEVKAITGSSSFYGTTYGYDYAGKLTSITNPDGSQVTYVFYPGTGLLWYVAVKGASETAATAYTSYTAYEPTGKIGKITYVNGTATTNTYDPYSTKLYGITTSAPSRLQKDDLQRKGYRYTPAGDIQTINDQINGIIYTYSYDNLHRLTSETSDTGTYPDNSYTYSVLGNITSKKMGARTYAYAYSGEKKHAMYSINYNGASYNYTYDANGNMLTGPDFTNTGATAIRTINYDFDNMPMKIVHSVRGTSNFIYDHEGRRAKATAGGSTTYYINPNYEITNGVVTKYITAGNMKVAQIKGSVITFYHNDHLGSSSVISNVIGASVEAMDYAPYGTMRAHTGTVYTNYRYTGKELDVETNLYYYGARYYDPMIGRFVSPDSIIPDTYNPQSLNPYSYCLNNPMIYVDPNGHEEANAGNGESDSSSKGGENPGSKSENGSGDNTFINALNSVLNYNLPQTGWFLGVKDYYHERADQKRAEGHEFVADVDEYLSDQLYNMFNPTTPKDLLINLVLNKLPAPKFTGVLKATKPTKSTSKIVNTTQEQLQKKFKHASDFGVTGNYSKANAKEFNSAVNQHLNAPGTKPIQGTYRGDPVTHHLDQNTGLNVITDQSGNFVSGWRLGSEQLQNVLQHGRLN